MKSEHAENRSKRSARRRVAFVTGTRAEFGLMESTLRAIRSHATLHLDVIASGIHLLPKFGRTIRDIEAGGWTVAARARMQSGDGDALDQARGLGRGVVGIAEALRRLRSDIVLVVGDRIEAMAGALAGVTTGRCVAHVHGGDVAAGDFDDAIRNAITKLAHLHLAATRRSAARIIRMGEERSRVHCVGAPAMDELLTLARAQRSESRGSRREQNRNGVALIVQHAYGRSDEHEERVMRGMLRAVSDAGLQPWIIYPNTDRGHLGVIAAIESFAQSDHARKSRIDRSLPRAEFLRALSNAAVLIGNSSSGIIEAPMIGTPSVNVGDRQRGRERGGPTVIDSSESTSAIRRAIRAALQQPRKCGRVYGDGQTGRRIATILASIPNRADWLRKRPTF